MAGPLTLNQSDFSRVSRSQYDLIRKGVVDNGIVNKPLLSKLLADKGMFVQHNGSTKSNVRTEYAGDWVTIGNGQPAVFQAQGLPQEASYPIVRKQTGLLLNVETLHKNGISIDNNAPAKDLKALASSANEKGSDWQRIYNVVKDESQAWREGYNDNLQLAFWKNGVENSFGFGGITSILTDTPDASNVGGISSALTPAWRPVSMLGLTLSSTVLIRERMTAFFRGIFTNAGSDSLKTGNLRAYVGNDFLVALNTDDIRNGQTTQTGFARKQNLRAGGENLDAVYTFSMNGVEIELMYDPYLDILGRSNFMYVIDHRYIKFCCSELDDFQQHTPIPETSDLSSIYYAETFTGTIKCEKLETSGIMSISNPLTF
jgi:hypothetical protein